MQQLHVDMVICSWQGYSQSGLIKPAFKPPAISRFITCHRTSKSWPEIAEKSSGKCKQTYGPNTQRT